MSEQADWHVAYYKAFLSCNAFEARRIKDDALANAIGMLAAAERKAAEIVRSARIEACRIAIEGVIESKEGRRVPIEEWVKRKLPLVHG